MSENNKNASENTSEDINETASETTSGNTSENTSAISGEPSAEAATLGKAAAATEPVKKSFGRELLEWVWAIVLAVIVAMIIRSFLFTVVRVDGNSMIHTLENNDRLIVWRLGYEPNQGDIVIFAPPIAENEGRNTFNRIYWVKRVIATGGQHVEINYSENAVYVDGKKLQEDYLPEIMYAPADSSAITSIDVPEDYVFLMGDNRNGSRDSRFIGAVPANTIVGKAVFRFWPFTSIGGVK